MNATSKPDGFSVFVAYSAYATNAGSDGFSTVESSINSYKPQKCGIFLSNFIFLYVACVACLWYNGLEVIMIEALF